MQCPGAVIWYEHLGPVADGVQIDAAVDEGAGDITPPCPQRVGPQRDWPLLLVLLHAVPEGHVVCWWAFRAGLRG